VDVDGVGGFPDGPERPWQRYPDQRYADQGFPERGFAESGFGDGGFAESGTGGFDPEPDRDSRPFGDRGRYESRPYADRDGGRERHAEPDENYRVPEPRFGDVAGPRYPDNGEPRYGGPDLGGPRYDSAAAGRGYDPVAFPSAPQQGGGEGHLAAPAAPPPDEQHLTQQIDRSALRRPPAGAPAPAPAGPPAGPVPTVYRSNRPALIILLVIFSIVVEMALLFVLGHSVLGNHFSAGEMLAAIFAMPGIPLTAIGFYAVVTGAPAASGAHPAQAWFRAPTAYLPIGLVLLLAAAAAVG
jgi:hypothetical protein